MVRPPRHRPTPRRGAAMILALVALMVTTSICISLTRTILLHQQRVEQRIWRHQADLLAQSGLDYARHWQQAHPDEFDTTWEVAVPGPDPTEGAVQIRFLPGPNELTRIVTVTADVPKEGLNRVRSSVRAGIPVSNKGITR